MELALPPVTMMSEVRLVGGGDNDGDAESSSGGGQMGDIERE